MKQLLSCFLSFKTALCSLLLISTMANSADSAVFLQYHHVSEDTPRSTSVTPDRLKQHLDYLDDNGFTVKSIVDVVNSVRDGRPLPDKTVVITFDDAYKSIYENAFPLLKEKGYPFTVFVAIEPVDKGYHQFLSWDQLREMGKHGATIANHSITHSHMVVKHPDETRQQWVNRNRDEILKTEARIKEKTGQSVKLFAWPFGEANPELRQLLASMGYVGFGQQSGVVGPLSDFTLLPRYPMAADYAEMRGFRTKVNSLPLPVKKQLPDSAMVTDNNLKPSLTLELADGDFQKNQLKCYASNAGEIPVKWLDDEKTRFTTVTPNSLSVGRSRYNCTAPSMDGRRYYWYSHQWLRLNEDGTAID
ncbi:polysaccharide deacetylase family protein [Endozoicomonas lisbonensis]|uniref:Biofilm PGA synthesis lipoprotein PgaB n=1 Tax=Endozoicomonas lisbonensis TaxID=3120522 RepID=A0ABV2SJP3_9GAMM